MGDEGFNRNVLFTCLGSPAGRWSIARARCCWRLATASCSADGLWGNVEDRQRRRDHRQGRDFRGGAEMVEVALRRGGGASCDNVTALTVEWERRGRPAGDTTQALLNSGYASTIHGALARSGLDGRREIERSIREINENPASRSRQPQPESPR